jgi:hypothetical protein
LDGLLRRMLYVWSWGDVTRTILRENRLVVPYESPRRRVGCLGWSIVSRLIFIFGRLDVVRHLWVVLCSTVIGSVCCICGFFRSLFGLTFRFGPAPIFVGKESFGLSRRLLVALDQVSPQHGLWTATLRAIVACLNFPVTKASNSLYLVISTF